VCPSRNSPGFNHYEHGVDVVRYLEGPYQITQGNTHTGLNLTPEVSECIFKHTYCQGGNRISHDEIRKRSKHKNHLVDGYCHLEGQAVRIADKISYLVSDIEDGIRLGAIDEQVLMSCKLFHRAPIDMSQPRGETLLHRFLLQRRRLIRVLMEDVIQESGRRIAKLNSPLSIRSQREYLISHSPVLDREVGEVWNRLQAQRLHTDPRVVRANMRAAKILSELLLIVAVVPEIVPREFRREHERVWSKDYMSFYRASMGSNLEIRRALIDFVPLDRYIGFARQLDTRVLVKIEEFILAKDFVASLTDVQAELLHQEFLR
jgi:dGTPase